MGATTANISRDIYDSRLRYVKLRSQQAVPWVDADSNDFYDSIYDQVRRVQQLIGDGSADGGFFVSQSVNPNDFMLAGGNSTSEGTKRLFVKGHQCLLDRDVSLLGVPVSGINGEAQRSIFPKVTDINFSVGNTTLEDSSANYIVNELSGRTIWPNVTNATSYTIISNTATEIVFSGDATSFTSIFDRYRIGLTTPASNRVDFVYINVFLDEVGANEDTNLLHPLLSASEAQKRWKVEQNIFVRQGDPTPLIDYVDSDGLPHFILKIAEFNRVSGVSTISDSQISNQIPIIFSIAGQQIDRFNLNVTSNGQTLFTLPSTPIYPDKVFLKFFGLGQKYGVDYTVSGNVLTWLDNDFTLEIGDELEVWFLE